MHKNFGISQSYKKRMENKNKNEFFSFFLSDRNFDISQSYTKNNTFSHFYLEISPFFCKFASVKFTIITKV